VLGGCIGSQLLTFSISEQGHLCHPFFPLLRSPGLNNAKPYQRHLKLSISIVEQYCRQLNSNQFGNNGRFYCISQYDLLADGNKERSSSAVYIIALVDD
jgi:hypothetical protein